MANATGYKVYYGTATRTYSANVDVKNQTAYAVTGLTDGVRYYFAVTDYNATTASGFSNEVSAIPTTATAAPVASFSASPASGTAPLTVSFTDASTGSVTAWSWTFGDGGTSTAKSPSHVYTLPGTYTVSLKVTDSSGATNTNSKTNYIVVATPTGGSGTSSGGSVVTVSGLVAAYGFEEVTGTQVLDASGNANHGTISGATRVATTHFGNAMQFSGTTGNWITVNDSNSLDLTTGMTLEAWVYPTTWMSGWDTVILKEKPGGLVYSLYANSNLDRPNETLHFGGSFKELSVGSHLPMNTWTHLAATYDGSSQKLYVNGALVGSRTQTGPMDISTSPLRIGGNSIWNEYFTGYIDEVRIYNRALTQAEITADYKAAVVGLVMSLSSDRSNPVPLNGVPLTSTNRYVYIHYKLISPTAGSNPVKQVSFWLDDANPTNPTGTARTDALSPFFDFIPGTASNPNGAALSFDTAGLSLGVHRVTARVTLKDGTVLPVINGTFKKQ